MKELGNNFVMNKKHLLVILIMIAVLFAFVVATLLYSPNNEDTLIEIENIENDNVLGIELLTEKPLNFEPQIYLNRYTGAKSIFDEDNNELTILLPDSYNEEQMVIDVSEWNKDNMGVYFSFLNHEDSSNILMKIESVTEDGGILLVEKAEEDESFSSFRVETDNEFISYVETCATLSNDTCTSIEESIAFVDAEIVTYSENSSTSTGYSSGDDFVDFTDEEIQKLLEKTNSRENRIKLQTLSVNEYEKPLTGGYCFRSKSGYENIRQYIPEFIFTSKGKKVFIGQEYGFIVYVYSFGKHSSEYEFDYQVNLTIFSMDSYLDGREYKYTTNLLFNLVGSYSKKKTGYTSHQFCIASKYNFLLADPSISLSVNNLYDLNTFNEGYDERTNGGIGISQVRVNFSGFSGRKMAEKDKTVNNIFASILSTGKASYELIDSVTELMTTLSIIGNLAEAAGNIGKIAGMVAAANPYVAVAIAAYGVISSINEIIDSYTTEFQQITAGNEDNILTFPAPSQGLIKDAVATFGLSSELINEPNSVQYSNLFSTTVPPELVLGEYNHYVQAIFMLSEINKPSVLTSYFNPSFAMDFSNWNDSKVFKIEVPNKYNYSERTIEVLNDGSNQKIYEDIEELVSFFGSNSRTIQLSVSETGVYDLYLRNFVSFSKISGKDASGEIQMQDLLLSHELDDLSGIVTLIDTNGNSYGKFDGNKISLNLSSEKDNIFTLQIDSIILGDQEQSYESNSYGATFKADLHKYYPELKENKITATFGGNCADYIIMPETTGAYTISVENATLDIYGSDYSLLNSGQKTLDIFLFEDEYYYIRVNKDGSNTYSIWYRKSAEYMNFVEGAILDIEFELSLDTNTKIYNINIGRTGIYTITRSSEKINDYSMLIKDTLYREMLFGANKVYLEAGTYCLIFKQLVTDDKVEDDIQITFTPQEITLEKDIKVVSDVFYTFIPKQDGYYTFMANDCQVMLDGENINYDNYYQLSAGIHYIVSVDIDNAIKNDTLKVVYTPSTKMTYNKTFTDKVVEFTTDITGYYSFNGEEIALYNKYLVLINDGAGGNFMSALNVGEKYFVINSGTKECSVVLEGEKLTANFEATIQAGNGQYLRFTAPEDGYYKLNALYADANNFEVYAYEDLSNRIAVMRTRDGYYLKAGNMYYIHVDLPTTDFITVLNGNITTLTELPEGTLAEVDLNSETSYAASYKFIPSESGEYLFIFSRNLKKEFSIYVDGQNFVFDKGSNVLMITRTLIIGNEYEITFNLMSDDSATLIFGVYRKTNDFGVYVSDRLQDDSGLVNKIAIGADPSGYVNEQVSVGNINGRASYTRINYEVLNAPIIDGQPGVTIDANGFLTISNKLPQWTAFAVEINIGRIQYGDVIIDEGITKVVNFLIYVDVTDIKIVDQNGSVVYNIDIAPKQSLNLTAIVFPSHAANAEKLEYSISDEDSKYVSMTKNGDGSINIQGLYTTPNKTYVKIYASCADEFTVVIMVRVYAEIIYVSSQNDVNKMSNNTKTAYELILNSETSVAINVPKDVLYLKIRNGSKNKLTDTLITVNSNDLTLVFESVEITGKKAGALINSSGYDLTIHFVGQVKLIGESGSTSSLINVKNLTMTKLSDNLVEIVGSNGVADVNKNGSAGQSAIYATGNVNISNVVNMNIKGGDGGDGSNGKDANAVQVMNPAVANSKDNGATGENGSSGEIGKNGGAGAPAIQCSNLYITGCKSLYIYGGNGGNGGKGGNGAAGGNGGKGGPSDFGNAGHGGIGGNGGNGAAGGNGGNGAQAVSGSVLISTSEPKFKAGNGGNAGAGGDGGNGGKGGDGGDDDSTIGKEGEGGQGGNGGNGGQAGEIGKKGAEVSSSQAYVNLAASDGSSAFEGYQGLGGTGGNKGDAGGYAADVTARAPSGNDGTGRVR